MRLKKCDFDELPNIVGLLLVTTHWKVHNSGRIYQRNSRYRSLSEWEKLARA